MIRSVLHPISFIGLTVKCYEIGNKNIQPKIIMHLKRHTIEIHIFHINNFPFRNVWTDS